MAWAIAKVKAALDPTQINNDSSTASLASLFYSDAQIQDNGCGAVPNGKTRGVSPAFPRMRQTPPSSVR